MKTIPSVLAAFLLTILAGCAGSGSSVALVSDGDTVPVARFPGRSMELEDPSSSAWSGLAAHGIQFIQAPPVHPSIELKAGTGQNAAEGRMRLARDDGRFFVWLQWPDASRNQGNSFDAFSDGAAVEIALRDHRGSSHMMGSAEAPVNIWYWKAAGNELQNLAAAGFGSTTQLDPAGLQVTARHGDGAWTLVFWREISIPAQDFAADLAAPGDLALAFAIWQGEEENRDGFKKTTTGWILARPASP